MTLDLTTGQPLPDSAIQRITFVAPNIHIYNIPPLSSNRGFSASSWTSPNNPTAQQIFTARLRIIETSLDSKIKVDIVLEDGDTGELFAGAPYTSTAVVQQANDSSRFFAVRVQGEGGMKATLGIGFEDRSPALDFNIALAEARKVLGFEGFGVAGQGVGSGLVGNGVGKDLQQDFSLKEGEKIHIELGKRSKNVHTPTPDLKAERNDNAALFSIAPPPGAAKAHDDSPSIVPPASVLGKSAQELGFDDGEFGEFQ